MPRPRREGYLLIDHRDSPGVPADLLRNAGLEGPAVGAGRTFESATVTCLHCNGMVILNPDRKKPRGYCSKCDGYVCDRKECGETCRPFDKLLDLMQEQYAKHVHFYVDGKCVGCGDPEKPWEFDAAKLFESVTVPLCLK